MKQGRITGIIFATVNVILIAVCVVLYLRTDRTAPEIEFYASEAVYVEGRETAGLLDGVRAYDKVDGDITERVVIEKITTDRESGSAVVYYAVSDYAGNVAKASRVFDAVYMEEEAEESTRFPEAGIDAEMNLPEKVQTMVKDNGAEEDPAGIEDREENNTPVLSGTDVPEGAEAPTKTPEKTPEPRTPAPPTPEPEPVRAPVPEADPSAPILTLKVSEVKVRPGQGPAWVDLIGTLSDDKDNYETLFRNLSVSKYDKDKAGSYAVSVHTEDSDGNRSQSIPLTIIVE